jgi:hypothetical protein
MGFGRQKRKVRNASSPLKDIGFTLLFIRLMPEKPCRGQGCRPSFHAEWTTENRLGRDIPRSGAFQGSRTFFPEERTGFGRGTILHHKDFVNNFSVINSPMALPLVYE